MGTGKTQLVTMTGPCIRGHLVTVAGLGTPYQGGGASSPSALFQACWFGEAGACVQAMPFSGWRGGPGALLLSEEGQVGYCSPGTVGGPGRVLLFWRRGQAGCITHLYGGEGMSLCSQRVWGRLNTLLLMSQGGL